MGPELSGEAVLVGVDTGGTFTDVFVSTGQVFKVPSTPDRPAEAVMDGLRAASMSSAAAVSHGTTVATNAVLERKGARTGLITTAGFEDLLAIRRQNRPSLYDLQARWPDPLVPEEWRFGAPERLDFQGAVLQPLDRAAVREIARRAAEARVESVAVCFLFSYVRPEHEQQAGREVRAVLGNDVPVSLSHHVAPQYGEFERTSTTVINAYVKPLMSRYLTALREHLAEWQVSRLHVMHSGGGLVSAQSAIDRPVSTVLSGPAAGVIGAQAVARASGREHVVSLDMGGTSTDVAVVPDDVLVRSQGEIASFPILVPMLTIETVGAGGGSIARVDAGGRLRVGPESTGADPGPAAYGRGAVPTVTDANLVLGRISPRGLLGGDMPLDLERSRHAMQILGDRIGLTAERTAGAVVRLVNSNMERAVRAVTLQQGYDPRRFSLVAFGGAGPLHAAELAEGLGITQILIPPHPGVMAALGLTVPDLQRDFYQTVLIPLTAEADGRLDAAWGRLESQALSALIEEDLQGFDRPALHRFADLRYMGQSFELRIPFTAGIRDLGEAFHRAHHERYGYADREHPVEAVNVRVQARATRSIRPALTPPWPEPSRAVEERDVWFGRGVSAQVLERRRAVVLWRPSLHAGTAVPGPAVLEQYDSTTVVPPGWTAVVDDRFNLLAWKAA